MFILLCTDTTVGLLTDYLSTTKSLYSTPGILVKGSELVGTCTCTFCRTSYLSRDYVRQHADSTYNLVIRITHVGLETRYHQYSIH